MRVAVVGLGNVGTTLAHLLSTYRDLLGVNQLRALKGSPAPWTEPDLAHLRQAVDELVVCRDRDARFEALTDIDVVFDCRREGGARQDRTRYRSLSGLRSLVVQGSEHGCGLPYVAGVNDEALLHAAEGGRCDVQVMSCNTHGTASLLRSLTGDVALPGLSHGDFVVVRRSEDVGAQERLVGAHVVARHRSAYVGTHHCQDAMQVFDTVGVSPALTSSDVTTPSQLLHTVRFALRFDHAVDEQALRDRLAKDDWLATTTKFDSNRVFELGRRYGFHGRMYAHAIVVENNLLLREREVSGWAFVPQEGNTLLSTLAVCAALSGNKDTFRERVAALREALLLRRL